MAFGRNRKNAAVERRSYYIEKLLDNAANVSRPSSSPIIGDSDVYINPQEAFKVWDNLERGELIYAEVATNSALVIPELILFDEKRQPITIINNLTFLQLLKIGRGMTPGRVQASATGQTQDEEGFFIPNMFHIARYKDDTLQDWSGNAGSDTASDRWFVGRFVASVPFPYSSISFYIKNTTTDAEPKRIFWYSLARTVYEDASAEESIMNPQPASIELANTSVLDEDEIAVTDPEEPNVIY